MGYFPSAPEFCEVVEHKGRSYLRYTLNDMSMKVIEYERVGIVSNFSYDSEFFGGNNDAVQPIIDLVHTQNQGLIQGIKNASGFRFLGKLGQTIKEQELKKIRDEFIRVNLDSKNSGGLGTYDQRFEEIKQIKSEPFALNAAQAKLVEESVWKYFGVSEGIVKNSFNITEIEAFINGKIKPFAMQLSAAMTNMTFSGRERAFGNGIEFYPGENDYLTIEQKLDFANRGVDRGIITINESRAMMGFPPVEGGDVFIRRLDYGDAVEQGNEQEESEDGKDVNEQVNTTNS